MFRSFSVLIILLALACAGCRKPPDPAAPSPLRFETRQYQRLFPGCGDKEKREEPCVTFRVSYPEAIAAPTDAIRLHVNAEILAALHAKDAPHGFQAEAESLIDDFRKSREEFDDTSIAFYVRRSAEIHRSTAHILSIEVTDESYTGGAHPNAFRSYINLHPSTGLTLNLNELLAPEAAPKLNALAETAFRRVRGIPVGRSFSEAGFTFPNGTFTLPRQWGATENGLIFYFNSYEIAPYSEGPTEFALPWSALREIIKPEAGLVPAPKS